MLNVEFPPEYPSHLPPACRVLEGVAADESGFFVDSLHALFYDAVRPNPFATARIPLLSQTRCCFVPPSPKPLAASFFPLPNPLVTVLTKPRGRVGPTKLLCLLLTTWARLRTPHTAD